ncbi:MAG: sigma-70 family RNA polymerase sigma factor [Myxococcota bacterium]
MELTADAEKDLARRIIRAEHRARKEVRDLPAVREVLQRRAKGSERTRAGSVDRLEHAIDEVLAGKPDPSARERALTARASLREAHTLRWQLAMSGVRIAQGEARKLRGANLDPADLTQEGFIGLLRAASRFDPDRDIRFGTYARWWVRAQMTRAIDLHGRMVRLPGCAVEQLRNLRKVMTEVDATGEVVDLAVMAARAGIDAERAAVLLAQAGHLSLDETPEGDEDGRTLGSILADPDGVDPFAQVQLGQEVSAMLELMEDQLDQRQRHVLFQRFGLQDGVFHSLTDIGRQLGLSRERVRQLERDALKALREAMAARPADE